MRKFRLVVWAACRLRADILLLAVLSTFLGPELRGQTVTTYAARTDRLLQPKTPMDPPSVNAVFQDPDFGSQMVRVTDGYTRPDSIGKFYRNASAGDVNAWNADGSKFFVVAQNGLMTLFGFDPSTMLVTRLNDVPFRGEAEFSLVDRDLMYGVSSSGPYVIRSFRFSNGIATPLFDTTTCGVEPPLSPTGTSQTVTVSARDARFAIVEGGTTSGQHMFIVIYDPALGCRWYNTETGQVGGQWGPTGPTTTSATYTLRGAILSRDGNSVFIIPNSGNLTYVWQVGTQTVSACSFYCGGYESIGYSHMVNSTGYIDEINPWMRPLNNLTSTVPLIVPLKTPHQFGMVQRWAWMNADPNDSVPVCGTTYRYEAYDQIETVWDGEIICIETDGLASTVWRFAHNRSAVEAAYFNTQPLGNISPDGRYYLFTSDWDDKLGTESDGTPRSDVWIVKLN